MKDIFDQLNTLLQEAGITSPATRYERRYDCWVVIHKTTRIWASCYGKTSAEAKQNKREEIIRRGLAAGEEEVEVFLVDEYGNEF